MAILSQRAYARQRGTSLSTVQKAINSGRISVLADGRIDADTADQEWEANTKKRGPVIGARRQPDDDGDAFGAAQYTKARAVREHYMARLARLEFQERTGELVSASEVKIAAFNQFRVLRDRLFAIPDRVAAMLAAETDEGKVYSIVELEIRRALGEFADGQADVKREEPV